MQPRWLILASLYLDSGTEYFAGIDVRGPHLYTGSVLNWGTIDRSIPVVPGLPTISDAKIRVADVHRHWRNILANVTVETPRRRLLDIKIVPEGEPEDSAQFLFSGEVVDVAIGPGYVEFNVRDHQFAWWDEPLPTLITKEIFPEISSKDEGGFLSIIAGNMVTPDSEALSPLGQIPCPHINSVPGTDRFGIAMHPVEEVVAVYRREIITVNDEDSTSEWVLVDPSEYTITEGSVTAFGIDFTPTYLDFFDEQPEHTEIRADVRGINFRGEWGPLPEEAELITNLIDFFISVIYLILAKAGIPQDIFNVDAIAALRERFAELLLTCRGAITSAITGKEFIAWFCTSSATDFFQDRFGLLTLGLTEDPDPLAPEITEGRLILLNSFSESLPNPVVNQMVVRYVENPADGIFATWATLDNLNDQFVLGYEDPGGAGRIRRVEKETVDFHFVGDPDVAAYVAYHRAAFLANGCFQQEFQIPLTEALELDLGQWVNLTHSQGIGTNSQDGYISQPVKILRISHDLNRMTTTLRTIIRRPIET